MYPDPMNLSIVALQRRQRPALHRLAAAACIFVLAFSVASTAARAQAPASPAPDRLNALEHRVDELQSELNELKTLLAAEQARAAGAPAPGAPAARAAAPAPVETAANAAPSVPAPPAASPAAPPSPAPAPAPVASAAVTTAPAPTPLVLPNGSTLNLMVDTYVGVNANQPVGRVNALHPYDVTDDAFSLNQAVVMFELLPDLAASRRYGLRFDLQYGQATATLQGNPANEPRFSIYQNIYQAYGRYIVPVGKGLTVDVGKWSSSIGYEGNYSKDQLQYSRSFFYGFLPDYHAGLRASYAFNDKLAVNYWMVNGINQTEPTNSFKDELFGFVYSPTKTISWTSNYYLGQENNDSTPATNCTIPTQPGLCATPINPAPNGRTHIFDNYVSWQATPKLLLGGEGDYFISRVWRYAAPGESAAPSHLDGGALYAAYQLRPRGLLTLRGEYMSDRNGLYSNRSQALKEGTLDYKYNFADGFVGFLEYRRDWSNVAYFLQGPNNTPVNHQDILTLGLIWSYGGKQGSW